MFGPAEQLQTRPIVGRDGVSVIGAYLEPIGYGHRGEDFRSVGRRLADILERSEGRIRVDQVPNLVMEVSRTEANSIFQQRNRTLRFLRVADSGWRRN